VIGVGIKNRRNVMAKKKEEGNVGFGHTQVPEGMTIFELKLYQEIDLETDEIIKKLTEMYPETVTGFKQYMLEEFITLKTDKEIMISLKGLWFRMNDKIQRLFNIILVRDSLKATNESVEDAWQDLSVYGKICRLVKDKKWGK
jgi:hypothetical protein